MEEDINSVYQILTNIGYTLKDYGREYRTKPIYRDSDNDTVLRIYKDSGFWVDFKENTSGDLPSLIKLSLKLNSHEEAKKWLKEKNFTPVSIIKDKPKIKDKKIFDKELLNKLNPDHIYWINRGVKTEVIKKFQGGVASGGKMKNRYVFPIFNLNKDLVGFSGRDITNQSKIKWKHLGDKNSWSYPSHLNLDILNEKKEIFLIESIGDCLSLWQNDIKNTIVTFGLEISISVLNLLLRIDPNKIYIAFNNDSEKNNAGNFAAEKARNKLLRYFDRNQIDIKLPIKKDFGEMTSEEIFEWKMKI